MSKKVIAGFAVHFGAEYLAHAIKGVAEVADEVHIWYAPNPSYGFSEAGAVCPHSEEMLRAEAVRLMPHGKPFGWHRVTDSRAEGYHKDLIVRHAAKQNADVVFVMDADEVWAPEAAAKTVEYIRRHNRARRYLMNFEHFWRSWKYVIRDGFRPVRAVNLGSGGAAGEDAYIPREEQGEPIYHFGYAQSRTTMEYKFTCHSHSPEFKDGKWRVWLENKFYGWKPGDTANDFHPSVSGLWTPQETPPDVLARVEALLYDHPYKGVHPIDVSWI